VSEQLADERASVAPAPGQVGGRPVMLIPQHAQGMEAVILPPDYQRILATVTAWRTWPPASSEAVIGELLAYAARDVASDR
jgi:hypothetical protein